MEPLLQILCFTLNNSQGLCFMSQKWKKIQMKSLTWCLILLEIRFPSHFIVQSWKFKFPANFPGILLAVSFPGGCPSSTISRPPLARPWYNSLNGKKCHFTYMNFWKCLLPYFRKFSQNFMVSLIKPTASVAVAFYFLTALSPLAPLWWLTRSVDRRPSGVLAWTGLACGQSSWSTPKLVSLGGNANIKD